MLLWCLIVSVVFRLIIEDTLFRENVVGISGGGDNVRKDQAYCSRERHGP